MAGPFKLHLLKQNKVQIEYLESIFHQIKVQTKQFKVREMFSMTIFFGSNFHSRRWGSSLPVCARLTGPIAPPSHEWKFSGPHVTFKHLPQPLSSHMRSFGILGQLLPFPPKYVIVQGYGGSPNSCFDWNPNIFVT